MNTLINDHLVIVPVLFKLLINSCCFLPTFRSRFLLIIEPAFTPTIDIVPLLILSRRLSPRTFNLHLCMLLIRGGAICVQGLQRLVGGAGVVEVLLLLFEIQFFWICVGDLRVRVVRLVRAVLLLQFVNCTGIDDGFVDCGGHCVRSLE